MFNLKSLVAMLLAFTAGAVFAAVDVNKASQAELEAVKGIGPGLSTRIVEARKSGTFADWADLRSRVKGVGEGAATKFSADGLTVNGKAFQAGQGDGKPTTYMAPKSKKEPKADKGTADKVKAAKPKADKKA